MRPCFLRYCLAISRMPHVLCVPLDDLSSSSRYRRAHHPMSLFVTLFMNLLSVSHNHLGGVPRQAQVRRHPIDRNAIHVREIVWPRCAALCPCRVPAVLRTRKDQLRIRAENFCRRKDGLWKEWIVSRVHDEQRRPNVRQCLDAAFVPVHVVYIAHQFFFSELHDLIADVPMGMLNILSVNSSSHSRRLDEASKASTSTSPSSRSLASLLWQPVSKA